MIEGAVLWEENHIQEGAHLRNCVLAKRNRIGKQTFITGSAIVGDDCVIGAENRLDKAIRLWPGTILQDQAISF